MEQEEFNESLLIMAQGCLESHADASIEDSPPDLLGISQRFLQVHDRSGEITICVLNAAEKGERGRHGTQIRQVPGSEQRYRGVLPRLIELSGTKRDHGAIVRVPKFTRAATIGLVLFTGPVEQSVRTR